MPRFKSWVAGKLRHRLGFNELSSLAFHYGERARTDAQELHGALCCLGLISIAESPKRRPHLARLIGTSTCEGLFICHHLQQALPMGGDVCEFGVAQGATSALMANELFETDRSLWLYDSFEGLPAPTAEDVLINDIFNLGSMDKYQGKMACSESQVIGRLAAIGFPQERYRVMKGFFSNSPSTAGPSRICFAYIDFDLYRPIFDALAFVDARMSPGGRVIVDDYGWFSAGAERAVDEFCAANENRWRFSLPPDFCGKFCILEKAE